MTLNRGFLSNISSLGEKIRHKVSYNMVKFCVVRIVVIGTLVDLYDFLGSVFHSINLGLRYTF